MLWMMNVGDSRAVLCKNDNSVLQLTQDHKLMIRMKDLELIN